MYKSSVLVILKSVMLEENPTGVSTLSLILGEDLFIASYYTEYVRKNVTISLDYFMIQR